MKIRFAGPGEKLVCENCGTELASALDWSDDGDSDYRWCPTCDDMVDGKPIQA